MARAEGPFDVRRTPETVHAAADGQLGRHSLAKTFQGGLEATSIGEMLSAGTATRTLDGKAGSFRLQHNGILNRGEGSLHIQVIPDSGTEGLTGLTGTMQINIAPGGAHSYVFDYEL